jgi:hypothetical protein
MSISDTFVGRAIVVRDTTGMRDRHTMRLALVDSSGNVWTPPASDVKLTGYVIGTAAAVSASDTVSSAIGKLEARIAALEAA